MMFTTRDRENDVKDRDCGHFSPNERYEGDVPTVTKSGIVVYFIDADFWSYSDIKPVKSIEMILRTRVEE